MRKYLKLEDREAVLTVHESVTPLRFQRLMGIRALDVVEHVSVLGATTILDHANGALVEPVELRVGDRIRVRREPPEVGPVLVDLGEGFSKETKFVGFGAAGARVCDVAE